VKRVLFIGGHGHHYLSAAVRQGKAEAIGLAGDGRDVDAARAAVGRRVDKDVPFYEDHRQAMDDLKPDAVSVGSIYAHNGEIVLEALQRGIKVVSDKPIAATWDALAAIEEHCAANPDAVLITEFDLRCRPAFRAARRAVERGDIGQPILTTAQKSYRWGKRAAFYKNRDDYGGTLLWIASHGIDAVWYVTGDDLAAVTGHQGNLSKPDYAATEDHVAVCYQLAGGGSAMVHADFLRPAAAPTHGDDRIRVAGSQGVVEVRDNQCMLITHDNEPADITPTGADADTADDMLAALDGATDHFGTAKSLTMARWLLHSRDATDDGRWIRLDD
jgi:predicted dehydrogenase